MKLNDAVARVDRCAVLLVFPIDNRPEPASLWSEAYPRSQMRWEWDAGGDGRVAALWHLREQLSRSGKVVYGKWYRGRATLIALDVFPALLRSLNPELPRVHGLSAVARGVLDVLEEDSPISTKALKRATDLRGKENEAVYTRALKELWERCLIAAYGEVDEGSFPSIAIGASQRLFEVEWSKAEALHGDEAHALIARALKDAPAILKFYRGVRARRSVI